MKKTIAASLTLLLFFANLSVVAYAQAAIELRGTVLDETRAYIPAVQVVLEDAEGKKYTAQTDELGRYRFTNLKPGLYTMTVEAEGFAKFVETLDLTQRRTTPFDITLKVFISEQLEVKNDASGISADPDQNLTSITLKAEELEALPDDPDELLETLRQMAGASADEASVYVGGFRERGRIPPKEAIQMIRINSNPFSAEFSEIGFSRIEIVTKPGSDTFHGGFRFNFNDESLNARNTFAPFRAPLQVRNYGGNFSGPIIRNRWGFFMNLDRRVTDENEVINATILDPVTLEPTGFAGTVLTPSRNFNFDIRSDYLATAKHTIGVGYRYSEREQENLGINTFDLPERAYNRSNSEHTLRLSLTSIVSERAVNEIRLQLNRRTSEARAITDAPAILVPDAFNSGGNQNSLFSDNDEDSLDLTNNLTYTYKKHTIKAGIDIEAEKLKYNNRSNFGGTYTFGSDFERDSNGNVIDADGNVVTPLSPLAIPISPLETYRRVTLGLPGYRPLQFSITRG
ncbi:MAG TPA: carboxypeptidase regulatory-like domain-containing protein, partial [Blastocatellia bacterium]|nr:carboxypeptidase regulatory-like domain-containing protein [Blastocatellia bacterium]